MPFSISSKREIMDEKILAIKSIVKGYDKEAKELLLPYFNCAEPKIRATITKTIGSIIEEVDSEFIMHGLTDPDARVRANTIEVLGILGDRSDPTSLIPTLEKMLDENEPRVVSNAVKVLWKLTKNTRNLSKLKESIEMGEERGINSVLFALGELKEILSIDILS